MYAIRYKELVKKDEGINNNIIMAEIVGDKDKLNVIYHQAEVRFKQQYKKKVVLFEQPSSEGCFYFTNIENISC